jgi:hypothetical protein
MNHWAVLLIPKKPKKKKKTGKADPVFCDTGGGGKNRGVSDVGRYGFV